jgi:hypothetical protein
MCWEALFGNIRVYTTKEHKFLFLDGFWAVAFLAIVQSSSYICCSPVCVDAATELLSSGHASL